LSAFLNRLSVKLAISTFVFVFALAGATILLVTNGFRTTQINTYFRSQEALATQGQASLLQFTSANAALLADQLQFAHRITRQTVEALRQPEPDGRPIQARFDDLAPVLLVGYPEAASIYFIHTDGGIRYLPGGAPREVLSQEEIASRYTRVLEAGGPRENPGRGPLWLPPGPDGNEKEALISAISPLFIQNIFQGVIGVEIPLDYLAGHLTRLMPAQDSFAFLVDPDGRLVPDSPGAVDRLLVAGLAGGQPSTSGSAGVDLPVSAPAQVRDLVNAMLANQSAVQKMELGGMMFALAYAPLPDTGWSLGLAAPVDQLGAPSQGVVDAVWADAESTIVFTLLMMGAFFLATLAATLLLTRRELTRPIETLVRGVRAVTAGRLDVQIPIPSRDELGMLAAAFNKMTGELSRRNKELSESSAALLKSEKQYRTLAENFPNGIVVLFDRDLRHTLADGIGFPGIGLSKAAIEGRTVWEVFPHDLAEIFANGYQAALQGKTSTFEITIRNQTYQVWALPIRVDGSEIVSGMAFTQDITERVQTQALLERRVQESTRELVELYQQTEQRSRELEALYRADDLLHRSLQLDQVLQSLVDVVVDILHADKASVQVWDALQERLVVRAQRGFGPSSLARLSDYRPGDGIAGKVFITGEPIAVENILEAPPPANLILAEEGVSSLLSVPITVGNEVFGVFGMDYARPRSFDEADQRLFLSLAQRAAVAIENARLYEQAQGKAALEERHRLARDLHDSVTQLLYSQSLFAETGRQHAARDQHDQAASYLARIGETAQQALKEMRLLIYELRPPVLEKEGLAGALRQRLDSVESRAGIEARLVIELSAKLPQSLEDALFLIAQEALNNSLKHARANLLQVTLQEEEGWVELCITDNGSGFNPNPGEETGGMGLANIRERAGQAGGVVSIESQPGKGTQVSVRIPLDRRVESSL